MTGVLQTLVAFLMCWLVASSLWIYPHSLSYFNESVGGPLNGAEHLLGSNVDWGQDLRYVTWDQSLSQGYVANRSYFDIQDIGLTPVADFDFSANPSGADSRLIVSKTLLALPEYARSHRDTVVLRDVVRSLIENLPSNHVTYAIDGVRIKAIQAETRESQRAGLPDSR